MNPETQLEILIDSLKLPSSLILKPWLRKLLANPGSLVIIAIESPLDQNNPHIGTAWLSSTERVKVRKALVRINASRAKRNETLTSELPH